jgi:hypothetical protein
MDKSCASSMTRPSTPYWISNSKSRYLRSLQRPREESPSAVKRKFPSAASFGSFLGAVTASTGYRRPPIVPAWRLAWSLRSQIPIVLPLPGSATMTCQLRLCHAWRKSRLPTALKGGLDKAIEEWESRSRHGSLSLSRERMASCCTGYSLAGSGVAFGRIRLAAVSGARRSSVSNT